MLTRRSFVRVLLLVFAVTVGARLAPAEAWRFGVMADTQWIPVDTENNSVAIHVVDAINRQFINAKVDLVLQVGDLTDNGTKAGLNTRAAHAKALAAAGIRFYPLRGNHEGKAEAAAWFDKAFPNLPGTPGNGGSSPSLPGAAGRTYSFVHKGVKFILLDQFAMAESSSKKGYSMADYQPWINRELAAKDHEHAFVLAHKNLLGQNHKDNLFGDRSDANPDMQNAFIGSLKHNGVRHYWSGHDHIHHRSLVTSPDGAATVQEIIGASDSYKFYTPKAPFSPREVPLAQQMERIGYYTYTVDGPRISACYYSAAAFGEAPATPQWRLEETFGYSLNGKEFLVKKGQPYTSVSDSIGTGDGYAGTSMRILAGSNDSVAKTADGRDTARQVTTGWAPKAEPSLASDILSLWGMQKELGSQQTGTFVIAMTFPGGTLADDVVKSGSFGLLARDSAEKWVLAIAENQGGTKQFVAGPWKGDYGLGTYGVDPNAGTAWAVVNHGGDFAVGKP
jgi:3',5'-cyclic AMP phosphodiesterase CpdA